MTVVKWGLKVKRSLAVLALSVSMITSALCFQNCARVAFDANAKMASSGTVGGFDHAMPLPIGNDEMIDPAQPTPPAGAPDVQDVEQVLQTCSELEMAEPVDPSPVKCSKDEFVTSLEQNRVFDSVRDLQLTSAHADFSVMGARNVRMTSVRGNVTIEAQSVQLTSYDAAKAGDRLRINTLDFRGMTAARGTILINTERFAGSTAVKGELCVRAKQFGSLTAVNGTVELIGRDPSQRSNMGSFTAVNGLLILKNVNVVSITSVTGKLVLINSRVERITSSSENIYMRDSSIGSITSERGQRTQF